MCCRRQHPSTPLITAGRCGQETGTASLKCPDALAPKQRCQAGAKPPIAVPRAPPHRDRRRDAGASQISAKAWLKLGLVEPWSLEPGTRNPGQGSGGIWRNPRANREDSACSGPILQHLQGPCLQSNCWLPFLPRASRLQLSCPTGTFQLSLYLFPGEPGHGCSDWLGCVSHHKKAFRHGPGQDCATVDCASVGPLSLPAALREAQSRRWLAWRRPIGRCAVAILRCPVAVLSPCCRRLGWELGRDAN